MVFIGKHPPLEPYDNDFRAPIVRDCNTVFRYLPVAAFQVGVKIAENWRNVSLYLGQNNIMFCSRERRVDAEW